VGCREMEQLRLRCLGRPVTYVEINAQIRPYMRKHVVYHKLYRLGVMGY